MTSVEHTLSVIAGIHLVQAEAGGLWEEGGVRDNVG